MNDNTQTLLDLLDREGRALHAFLYRLTLDPHTAEDLMQELFLKLAASRAFRTVENPTAYARKTALHLALDWRRSRRPPASSNGSDHLFDPSPSPHLMLVQHEQWNQILDAAAQLTGLTREVFVLHYIAHESFEQIAIQLGKTPHQVRALCHKAVEYLRTKIKPALTSRSQE